MATEDLKDLLGRALAAASRPRTPRAIAAALSQVGPDLKAGLEALQVPMHSTPQPPEGLQTRVGVGAPVLVRHQERWLLLRETRGGQVLATSSGQEPRWMPWDALLSAQSSEWILLAPPPIFPRSTPGDSPLRRLGALLLGDRADLVSVLLYACGVGLLSLASPIAVQALVNNVSFGTAMQPVVVLALLLAFGLALGAGLQLLQAWVVELLRRRLFVRLVSDLTYRLPRVSASALRGGRGPELVNRFFDVFTLEKGLSTLLGSGVGLVVTTLVGLGILAVYHPALLVFDLLLGVAVVFTVLGLGRGGIKSAIKESKAKYAMAAWLEEVARHPIAFKGAGASELAVERADDLARDFLLARSAHFKVVLRQIAGALGLQVLATAGLLGVGGWLVISRQLTLGQLVAAELIVAGTVAALAKSGKLLEAWYDVLAAVDKIGQLTDLPLEPVSGDASTLPPGPLAVSLRSGALALEVAPGERVGLVGPTGIGKSGILEGLFGAGDPVGSIGGVRLQDLDRAALRRRVALVQGVEVVAGSVLENLRFGRRAPDRPGAWEVLRQVGLDDAVNGLPGGLDALLTPTGTPLGSAATRRLVLARALAGAPSLLLIDGALDGHEAGAAQDMFDRVFGPERSCTAVIVSHDASVLARCDRVLHISSLGAP